MACQTCHIPAIAREEPTKVSWDWSKAGQKGREDDHYTYLKIKGEFSYESNFAPTYLWFNGNNEYRYLLGDPISRSGSDLHQQARRFNINDPKAKIFPFKLHVAKQPYDKVQWLPAAAGDLGQERLLDELRLEPGVRACRADHQAWPTAASTTSPRPRCTGPAPTWFRPPMRHCSAMPATPPPASRAGWTGRPWATPATRSSGAGGSCHERP